ncbi:superoxide dismutase [Reticulomyxa filosa]|uniref:Superoxide dismutase n=1 Tax=Reticulomyxa filosa TaxID=46433 RepID=X6NA56_RETFI|nr:superoxide dismutase [Reticulomyxa filosa]|eukprot:ETO22649.1 superoxide dismutase [Reticulomyxa filosa]
MLFVCLCAILQHHAAYVSNLNTSLQKRDDALSREDLAAVIELDHAIKFNGGGHVNHSIFWTNLAPVKHGGGDFEGNASQSVVNAIKSKWQSVEKFQETFNAKTAAVQGSGWGWLVYDPADKQLKIQTTSNQDPVGSLGVVPLLGIDVWEHAYYLKYENRRPEYLKEIWKVVNWKNVAERYTAALKK